MVKRFILIYLISISAVQLVKGQSSVSVLFIDRDKNAVEGVTAELLRSKDSVVVKIALSDKSGAAEFVNIKNGSYIIKGSLVNHHPGYSSVFFVEAGQIVNLPSVVMRIKDVTELSEVRVVTKKPFIQRLNDRLVVNVESSIVNAGSTALEVLEKSPGVTITSSDIISLKGKTGVIVMIDGKPASMNGTELVTYLKSLPSSLIQQIDLITNPSARYDAAGNAGIIDIRMKKSQRLGTNGSITTGYGQGVYPKSNSSFTFNNRGRKTNLYGNAGFNFISWLNNLLLRRDFFEQGNYKGSYEQDNFIRRLYRLPSGRLGFDYYISKKSVLGFVVSTNLNFTKRTSSNRSVEFDEQQNLISVFTTAAKGKENSRNYLANVNFKHSFDTAGREISLDADYSRFVQDWLSDYTANYFDKFGNPSRAPYVLNLDQDGLLQIKSAKIDYVHPANKRTIIEAGIKTSFVTANNSVLFFDMTGGSGLPVIDSSNSNHFLYNENINGGYLNIKRQYKKMELQVGVRGEATRLRTNQLFTHVKYDVNYFQLFPSIFFSYKFNENNSFSVSAGRRIDRPTYGQLNPFRIFIDPSFYASGDPNIKAQTTWAYELNYTFKQLNFELGYSHTKNLITYVLMPTANRVTLQTAVNFDSQDYLGLTVAAPAKVTKWWNSINNVNLFYSRVKGFVAETNVDASYLNVILSTNNSFTLSKTWSGEINFSLNTGGKNGVMADKPYISLSPGIQKTVMQNRATLRFNITDILWKAYPRFTSRFSTYREDLKAIRDTRVVTLSFTYRFGNSKVQAARRRTTASEEERRRAGGN